MKRHWVKLWVNEWLEGTTRFQMTGAQRAFWTDLLAMAGRSRFPGIVCSGRDGEIYVGYPLTTFSALDPGAELDIPATFDLFVATGKIAVDVTSEKPVKLYKVTITNWGKYQSEYQRQKPYQDSYRKKGKSLSTKLTPDLTPNLSANYLLEGEVRSEKEKEKEKEKKEKSPAPKPVRAPDPVGFLKFWEAYPLGRRVDRKDALRAWMKGDLELFTDQILAGLLKWIYCEQWASDQFIPHPATFLNKRRWEAEPPRETVKVDRDANAGKYDPNRPVKEQTPEEIAEFKRMEIESQRWDRLEKGTLPVSAETVEWVKEKVERFRKAKLPPTDPRPKWFKGFLDRAALEKVGQVAVA